MATRRETTQRRQALYDSLCKSCRDGSLRPGEMLPPLRELVREFQLSINVVSEVLTVLVNEGVLYSIPRVGTFVGKPQFKDIEVFLLISPWVEKTNGFNNQIQIGFEERIAQLGGISLMLTAHEARLLRDNGGLPPLKGVFEVEASRPESMLPSFEAKDMPCAYFGNIDECNFGDAIHFDDEDGGVQATRHLMATGHHRIAFLGLHSHENEKGNLQWSAEREAGWRIAMKDVDDKEDLVFRASHPPLANPVSQYEIARETAMQLVLRDDIEAVVAANFPAVNGLLEALKIAEIPSHRWPSVVGFDDPMNSGAIVSYLRLPWEQIGRGAAEILYDRANGKIQGARQQRLVSMNLIPRLSSRGQWTSMPGSNEPLTTSHLIHNPTLSAASRQLLGI